jgi:hypothetical protein
MRSMVEGHAKTPEPPMPRGSHAPAFLFCSCNPDRCLLQGAQSGLIARVFRSWLNSMRYSYRVKLGYYDMARTGRLSTVRTANAD